MKKIGYILAGLVISIALAYILRDQLSKFVFKPTQSVIQEGVRSPEAPISDGDGQPQIEVIAESLQIPWEIAFLPASAGEPDGSILTTERPGNLLKIDKDKKLIEKIAGVEHVGEGGLQGLAIHPNFRQNRWIYLYLTTKSGNTLTNRIERYVLDNEKLRDKTIILEGIPGAQFHDGGRIEFAPPLR